MGLSIITPHYNDFGGIQEVYKCLLQQTETKWEWVIVDDFSNLEIQKRLEVWLEQLNDQRVRLLFNPIKSNASVCRNKGVAVCRYHRLVFLDSDDAITPGFVANRQMKLQDFIVLARTGVIDKYRGQDVCQPKDGNFLNNYLKAQFLWPITAILWDKSFFIRIGQFHQALPRLQDVELAIRALQASASFEVIIDNPVDFYYHVKPIRERYNFVQPVCKAVYTLMSDCLNWKLISTEQKVLLSGYYFACVRYLERSGSLQDIDLVTHNLHLFYEKGIIDRSRYWFGWCMLKLYHQGWVSNTLFLRVNRRLFKPA